MDSGLGQTEGDKEEKEEKINPVHWKLDLAANHRSKQVQGSLKMPNNLPSRYKEKVLCSSVVLELHDEGDCNIHAINIMRNTADRNILQVRLVLEDVYPLLYCVEPYDGNLKDILDSKNLGVPSMSQVDKVLLPTTMLASAVSEAAEGLEQLRASGAYHGNFTLKNTYYIMDKNGALRVKLSGFKKQTGSLKEIISRDWSAFRAGLVEIQRIAQRLNATKKGPKLLTCQLDGLVDFLRNIGPMNSESAFEPIRRQPFFWGKEQRKTFYISTIPLALAKDDFRGKVKIAIFIDVPWGEDGFDGFLSRMDTYREVHKKSKKYDTTCRVQFVQFICGCYAHEKAIKNPQKIDVSVQRRHPELCYKLYSLLPGVQPSMKKKSMDDRSNEAAAAAVQPHTDTDGCSDDDEPDMGETVASTSKKTAQKQKSKKKSKGRGKK